MGKVRDRSETCAELAALSGWPLGGRERGDVLHGPRAFPAKVKEWRENLAERILDDPPQVSGVPDATDKAAIRDLVDSGLRTLREVARILAGAYGNPRLGNKDDPVDELIYIILSRKTRESAYQETFAELRSRFDDWDDLLAAPREAVEAAVYSGGLSSKKTDSIFAALSRIQEEFGSCTMDAARDWDDEELFEFLCSLPEIGPKSAYCIMLYSFDRQVFPVDTHVGRCLTRIAPYRELGLDLRGLDHKKLQALLPDFIPPNLRYSLHVNLVAHGRAVCNARTPDCDRCFIQKFCLYFRRQASKAGATSDGPSVVDLFAGAGGMSLGFRRAGFRILAAADMDLAAVRTYALNHPEVPDERLITDDLRDLEPGDLDEIVGEEPVDVLIGAPPCQGYSSVGYRSKQAKTNYRAAADDRNYLFECMIDAAEELQPRLFLMENVPGMSSTKRHDLSFLELAARELEERCGYRTQIWKLNAAAFGVPQERTRHFLVASHSDLLPPRPPQEYEDPSVADYDVDALPAVTVAEAIEDLPPRQSGEGQGAEVHDSAERRTQRQKRRYLEKFDVASDGPILFNHTVRDHNEDDIELYDLLRPGENSVHAIEVHGRPDLMRYRRDVFDDKYSRMRPDRPSRTIVAHLAKDGNAFIHPDQPRSITPREAARLQSFPDDYIFCGAPTHQWQQIGNAVPPLLAEAIARSFRRALDRMEAHE